MQNSPYHLEAGSGPPLLLLHGLFDSSETWVRLIPYLSAQFKVYAIDLPGFGKTPLPGDWGESLSGMVDAVIGFLDQQEIEQISLIGSSMGGALSLAVAADCPSRIRKIALLNPYGLPSIPLAVQNAKRWVLGRVLPYLLFPQVMRPCVKAIFSRSLFDRSILTKPLLEQVAKPFSTVKQRKNLSRFLRAISPEKIKEIDALLPQITQPVLIVWGEEDAWLSNAHWQRLSQRLPRVKVIPLSRSGHLPQIDRPEAVAAALIPFFFNSFNSDGEETNS